MYTDYYNEIKLEHTQTLVCSSTNRFGNRKTRLYAELVVKMLFSANYMCVYSACISLCGTTFLSYNLSFSA